MTMRAVCYPRVSGAAQRERHTIASQLTLLPEFAARMGWQLVRPPEAYCDDGFTAKAGNLAARRGFDALMRDAVAGVFDVVIVISIDRLTRSEDLVERGAILGGLQRAGVKVADALSGQVLDFSTDMGDLFGSLQAVWAAMDNRKRREKTVLGKHEAARSGRKPQGPTPYGLKYDRDLRQWSIDPVRGPILREIFERTAAGESGRTLAADFNARGLPAPRQYWERGRITHLVQSRHAIGEWLANREKNILVKVPAIIDRELWDRAQRALVVNRTRPPRVHSKNIYLLERMASCSACGGSIAIRAERTHRRCAARYVCRRRKELLHDGRRCSAPTLSVADADAAVWVEVSNALQDPLLGERLLEVRVAGAENQRNFKADVAGYKRRLAQLQTREEAIVSRFRKGTIGERTLDQELAALARERGALEEQLRFAQDASSAAAAAQAEVDSLESMLGELRTLAATATPVERRELVRRFVEPGSVSFHGNEIRLTLWIRRGMTGVALRRSSTRTEQAGGVQLRVVV
jgi:site-specific DNA recombinase